MNFSFTLIDNVQHLKMVSASATYGIGLLTAVAFYFCNLFGIECKMYDQKIEKAKQAAANKLINKARAVNATGIMNVKIEIHGTTIFMYGIAYYEK